MTAIPTYIKEALSEQERVVVPGLGTFSREESPSLLTENGSLISPPTLQVQFSDSVFDLGKNSLSRFVAQRHRKPVEGVDHEAEAFSENLKQVIEEDGTAKIEGLGAFYRNNFGDTAFTPSEDLNLMAESYGLPQLKTTPLYNALSTRPESKVPIRATTANPTAIWAAASITGLLIIAGALYTFNDNFNQTVKGWWGDQKGQLASTMPVGEKTGGNDVVQEGIDPNELAETSRKDMPSATEKKETATQLKESKQPITTKKEIEPTKSEKNISANPSKNSKASVVSQKTNRYYLIMGSFSDIDGAQRAVNLAKSKGYRDAKIIDSGNRIRVSVSDHADKDAAEKALSQANKDFSGVWRLRF